MKIRSCHFAWAKPFKALYSVGKFQTIYHYPQPQTLYNLISDYIRLLVPLYNAIDKLIFFSGSSNMLHSFLPQILAVAVSSSWNTVSILFT